MPLLGHLARSLPSVREIRERRNVTSSVQRRFTPGLSSLASHFSTGSTTRQTDVLFIYSGVIRGRSPGTVTSFRKQSGGLVKLLFLMNEAHGRQAGDRYPVTVFRPKLPNPGDSPPAATPGRIALPIKGRFRLGPRRRRKDLPMLGKIEGGVRGRIAQPPCQMLLIPRSSDENKIRNRMR